MHDSHHQGSSATRGTVGNHWIKSAFNFRRAVPCINIGLLPGVLHLGSSATDGLIYKLTGGRTTLLLYLSRREFD